MVISPGRRPGLIVEAPVTTASNITPSPAPLLRPGPAKANSTKAASLVIALQASRQAFDAAPVTEETVLLPLAGHLTAHQAAVKAALRVKAHLLIRSERAGSSAVVRPSTGVTGGSDYGTAPPLGAALGHRIGFTGGMLVTPLFCSLPAGYRNRGGSSGLPERTVTLAKTRLGWHDHRHYPRSHVVSTVANTGG